MAIKTLIDTSVLIEMQKHNSKVVSTFHKQIDSVQISRIAACEIVLGSRDRKERRINLNFIDSMDIVEINKEISLLAFNLIIKYGLKTRLGIADALIAATAIINKNLLWTMDTKHFTPVKELNLFIPKNPSN
ncbi:TPA: type II toxin-antitoxin system VapC family toxin [candidate division WWE3 bacterium]|uniref:Type II toxin-antitoxin system VapC family toxin n=1 Tax=candidate division WWE3 bacterium TaxID=2053526 RepID=A0A656PPU1_UNCKA|nr:putative ribonuclease VapC [candidate division WWE3 bacterium RAAC2_WWE3_1]KKS29610.1 MAG: putative ribonuclease VapC [candidate division WWE3 bacterium GW2011_GWB1_42_117]KKS55420.1 MAG: putative ribonuclease VapC [candidate division WWE3 bacterium GW2011_GWD2_42_34]KKT05905.1 MAG: putative ribonuclease VapC [candidate division WWE3 bacterium GW2011_GWE2_43_18]KKT07206.1 MAG: putative ribonuclease VapC [candidate division WWE3 bacterium GW2011_GWF2_43_18]KKT08907.1 MAG: putative ribonuclea